MQVDGQEPPRLGTTTNNNHNTDLFPLGRPSRQGGLGRGAAAYGGAGVCCVLCV